MELWSLSRRRAWRDGNPIRRPDAQVPEVLIMIDGKRSVRDIRFGDGAG